MHSAGQLTPGEGTGDEKLGRLPLFTSLPATI
jgi:hypothetical protein